MTRGALLISLNLLLAGCMGFLAEPQGAVYVEDQVGDAPEGHDIAWARWDPEEPRFELGMAEGEVEGSRILATFRGADQEVGVYLMRTDDEMRLTYVEDCPDCDFQTISVVAQEHDVEGGKAWTWTHQKDSRLSRGFVVQTFGSDGFGENNCVYDQLATGAYPDSPACGEGDSSEEPADLPVIDGSTDSQRVEVPPMHHAGCTAAIWNDPGLLLPRCPWTAAMGPWNMKSNQVFTTCHPARGCMLPPTLPSGPTRSERCGTTT